MPQPASERRRNQQARTRLQHLAPAATSQNDIDALVQSLSEDAELVSPLSGRMVFRGRDDLRVLLGAVYSTVAALRWSRELVDGDVPVIIGECRIGPLKLGDAMILELAADGLRPS